MSMPLGQRTLQPANHSNTLKACRVHGHLVPALHWLVHRSSTGRYSEDIENHAVKNIRCVRTSAITSCKSEAVVGHERQSIINSRCTSGVEKIDHVDHSTFDDAFYSGFVQPSQELKELCSRQLEAVYEFLTRCGNNTSNFRSTVYVRCADIISRNSLQLRKVVSHIPGGPSPLQGQYEDDNILQLAGPDGESIPVEEYLLQQSVLELPSSPTLVLPLCEGGVLVGLLVLERSMPAADLRPWAQISTEGSASLFTEDELWFFRKSVPSLAAACAMELRVSMTRADVSARQQSMATLLQGTRGPLTALRTFGSMLLPRLHEGEPDRDLASNMVVQSNHLEEVVQQLQAALRPEPTTEIPAYLDSPSTLDHLAFNTPDYPSQIPFHPFASAPVTRDIRDTRIPRTLLSPASHNTAPTDQPHDTTPVFPSQHLPSTALELVSPPGTSPIYMRPSGMSGPIPSSPPSMSQLPPSALQSLTIQRGVNELAITGLSDECIALIPPPQALMSIDLDTQDLTATPSVTESREWSHGGTSTSASSGGGMGECHLADTLVNVLTAAHNMCAARGQQMVVAHPLRIAAPKAPRHVAPLGGAAAEAAPPPRLLPRPVRPVYAAAPAAVVSQAMSYVLEVVLASCSPGGLVGVTAQRTDASSPAGIQLIVLFTGTVRLVPPNAASEWQVALGGASGRPEGAAGASSLELAQNLLQRAGGRISITYPCKLKSRRSNSVEVGTCVEIWLPAAKAPVDK